MDLGGLRFGYVYLPLWENNKEKCNSNCKKNSINHRGHRGQGGFLLRATATATATANVMGSGLEMLSFGYHENY